MPLPGCAGTPPATGRRPALANVGKMPRTQEQDAWWFKIRKGVEGTPAYRGARPRLSGTGLRKPRSACIPGGETPAWAESIPAKE